MNISHHWICGFVPGIPRCYSNPIHQFCFRSESIEFTEKDTALTEKIATTFLGVHLLTSYQNTRHEEEDEEDSISQVEATPGQGAIHLDDEQTPLLLPINPRDQTLLRRISGTPSAAALPPQIRVIRKSSKADLTSTLGINTQAGFLLMATTPPASSSSFGNRGRMDRSKSGRELERGVSYASTRRGS